MFIKFGSVSVYDVLLPTLNETISVCVTVLRLQIYRWDWEENTNLRLFFQSQIGANVKKFQKIKGKQGSPLKLQICFNFVHLKCLNVKTFYSKQKIAETWTLLLISLINMFSILRFYITNITNISINNFNDLGDRTIASSGQLNWIEILNRFPKPKIHFGSNRSSQREC